jgi:hypothetical protein
MTAGIGGCKSLHQRCLRRRGGRSGGFCGTLCTCGEDAVLIVVWWDAVGKLTRSASGRIRRARSVNGVSRDPANDKGGSSILVSANGQCLRCEHIYSDEHVTCMCVECAPRNICDLDGTYIAVRHTSCLRSNLVANTTCLTFKASSIFL